MKDVFIVVPTLDPDEQIMNAFIKDLHKEFKHILVINDGSNKKHNKFFKSLEEDGIEVFTHHKNLGKGRALKNGFNYILAKYPKIIGCVTCDSDGQHSVKDIIKCANSLKENPEKLILGVRDFDKENVPPKSKFGNKVTRAIFKILIGLKITDTQTGLRGFGRELMEKFVDTPGERYEYETKMLIACKEENIKIKEVIIETIYIDSNAGSHFNPIKDSIKIYKMFTKYFLLALSSYLIDILVFCAVLNILNINSKILAATIFARILSSIFTYSFSSKLKFTKIKDKYLFRYCMLSIVQMIMSGCFVAFFYNLLNINVIIIKVLVDLVIWLINIFIQSEWVFNGDDNE